MAEIDHFNLFRKYRVLSKNDDDIFNIKYVLADDKAPKKKGQDESQEKSAEKSSSKQQENIVKGDSKEHDKKVTLPAYFKNKVHGSENGKESKPKPKVYKKKEWKDKAVAEAVAVEEKLEKVLEKAEEPIGEREEKLKKQIKQLEKKMEKDKITKSKEQYELFQKLANDNDDDSQEEEELDKLGPIPLISKRSKSSQFKDIFSEMDLARKSQIFIRDPRRLYDEYIDIQTIDQSRENNEGIYYRGITQFSDTVKWYCNIISNELEGSLVVEGRNTNRALHEDEVYFKVISQGKEKILCAVVAIVKRRLNEIVGKIELNKAKQLYLLKPTNAKLAKMNINLLQINKQWLQNVYTKYFLAKFSYWDATDDHPYCKIISEYGNFGQVEIETMALLKNYGIENRDYSQKEIQEFLQPFHKNIDSCGEYIIPAQELKKRKDFRKWRTFIVKNSEFDAAFSISPLNIRVKTDPNFLKKNIYEINVHFIDVAHFVREKTALDEQAKKKQASYNLVYKILSLLPAPLADTICNLRHNKQILTISVGFQIDEEGNILEISKIAKSIICPPFIFSADEIQKVISTQVPFEQWRSWNCGCEMQSQYKAIAADIKLINKVISKRRQNRIMNGALAFEIPTKTFKFDENAAPCSFELKAKSEASSMIEECVISASIKVGEYLFKNLKGKAILYRHRFPGFKRLNKFKDSLKKMGQNLPQNSTQIQKFINEIILNGQAKQCIKDVIKYQTIKLLQNFDYFQVQNTDPSAWIHYAINTPIYTHCSTPKRYYGDLLVQRQLASILDGQPITTEQPEMKDLIDASNKGKQIAQNIRIGCQKLFLCLYLNKNPVFTNAVLTAIEEWGLKICIPKFNFKTMIKFKDLKSIKVTKFNTDDLRKSVKLDFSSSDEDFKTKIVLKEMQEINIQIKSANTYPLDYAFSIVLPHPTLPEQKLVIA